ncbi:putative RNA-directed DNA polymerase [Tanacetum coccineum]
MAWQSGMNRTWLRESDVCFHHAELPASFWRAGAAKMFHNPSFTSLWMQPKTLDEDLHPELPQCLDDPFVHLGNLWNDEHKKEWFDAMQDEMKSFARWWLRVQSEERFIDFDRMIFSPVVKMGSIRVVLGLAASLDLEVEQMDVKTAFLHGDLDKEIYMEQPEGFQVKGKEDYVCRLQKSLYGLKQAPRQWYKKFESCWE